MQKYIYDYNELNNVINISKYNSILVVCSKSSLNSFLLDYIKQCNSNINVFTDFNPNPLYEDVVKGIDVFKKNKCDLIVAIGGGSAIDVAKTIKAFSTMDENENYLNQQIIDNGINLLAVPTTAGTGSESTKFSVVYFNGEKYSIDDDSLLPNYVLLDPNFLTSLPLYQKKSTMLDALCQAIESYWSINSTDESKKYASEAIQLILKNYKEYIKENKEVYLDMLKAANYSGKAINISKTTAAHAMSYKITSLYGISHGHAVALCLPHIWKYMIENIDKSVDPRGEKYLDSIFCDLDKLFNTTSHNETLKKLDEIYKEIDLKFSNIVEEKDLDILTGSVNENRLKNNPVFLEKEIIREIYSSLR